MPQRPTDPRSSRPSYPTAPAFPTPNKPRGSDKSHSPLTHAALARSLYARRTLIPILLTLGVLFCLIGIGQWMTDADYPFAAQNMMWSAIALPAVGVCLLVIAAFNMNYVRNKLRAARK